MEGDVLSQVRESVYIDASPDVVWGLVTDVNRHTSFAGSKSITKKIEFDGRLEVGNRWNANEKFGPSKFIAPSEITKVELHREFAWVSFPPVKNEEDRGTTGGRVLWSYILTPEGSGTRLAHNMDVLLPKKGGTPLKIMYKILSIPKKQRAAVLTSLNAIKTAAEAARVPSQDEEQPS